MRIVSRKPRLVASNPPRQKEEEAEVRADFSDPHSEAVLDATARIEARELGRQYYRSLLRNRAVHP